MDPKKDKTQTNELGNLMYAIKSQTTPIPPPQKKNKKGCLAFGTC